ncbi:MAG: ATP-binding protein [Solobacterium sp.]|nr:ATP-binding protein [Solobacterium sp.]MBR0477477.1 ATP-binding protein [Solobacterium sp.]
MPLFGHFKKNEDELTLEAKVENIPQVLAFIDERLEKADCALKSQMQIDVAVDEIFSNISKYAYEPGTGKATVRIHIDGNTRMCSIAFIDRGIQYNPTLHQDPDITLDADHRDIGGLGIYLVKRTMDGWEYTYEDGRNIQVIHKSLDA